MVFLKEKEIILTNVVWRVTIDLSTAAHEEVISAIRRDLHLVERKNYGIYLNFRNKTNLNVTL